MRMHNGVYVQNKHGVYSDNFDAESVVVNLNVGNYYNLRNLASQIWNALDHGVNIQNLTKEITDYYKIDQNVVEIDVTKYIEALINEGLVIESKQEAHQSINIEKLNPEYIMPQLETFSDLQDLFLLDPVHAVDDKMGWPVQLKE